MKRLGTRRPQKRGLYAHSQARTLLMGLEPSIAWRVLKCMRRDYAEQVLREMETPHRGEPEVLRYLSRVIADELRQKSLPRETRRRLSPRFQLTSSPR